ncbi:response regulator [Dactylosporangium siamense]|uniref:Transcriptional regulatory protein n=1 Tax=Dactylosporangium siamense TaxID=685454 RepID=A0A919UES8_9ACTN|nr:response regulator [Dactylosporangium siamense]GIG47923.1 transcriptional regulatory protein [Dactylosporangium siamense]
MIRVLVVEDEPIAADAHVVYVGRVPGFAVAGRAGTGADALRLLSRVPVDLVLLDMHLPDLHGLEVVRAMRAAGHRADVIAVTSARDLAVVRAAVSQGIVQYLLKPFVFATLRDKLDRYRDYRRQVLDAGSVSDQHEVDRLLATLRSADPVNLPKGMSQESLDAVSASLRGAAAGRSAAEVAAVLGASRVTARRYLEHLADVGLASRHARYGNAGRPEVEYRWKA